MRSRATRSKSATRYACMAPCAACHGPLGLTLGAPGLQGQQRAYPEQQLQAFTAGCSTQ